MKSDNLLTETLDIAYLEEGPVAGRPVVLLHGFPDDASGYTPVMQALAAEGYRCFAPYLRGFGPTRFRDADTPRAADFAALGQDALDFIDTLALADLIVVGQDWGSPAAEICAAFRPGAVTKLVKLNWYGIYTMAEMARASTFAYPQLRALWYVWMINTPMGEMVLRHDCEGFCQALWEEWSPSWEAGRRSAAFDAVKRSFDNPDFARIALSAYRSNITPCERDERHDVLRKQLENPPPVECETIVIRGADDGVEKTPLTGEQITHWLRGPFREVVLDGVGHFPHREAADAVVRAIVAPNVRA